MPRLMDTEVHQMGGNFSFTGARISDLGATEYTLVDIEVDESGSVHSFRGDLVHAIETIIEACRKSPRSDNLLLRVGTFSTAHPKGVSELHGYKPLADIDPKIYDKIRPAGATPLLDACYVGIGAMNAYGKMLSDQDFLANGITFIVTDGEENASTASVAMVKTEIESAVQGEILESHVSVLIGIGQSARLQSFQQDLGITQYVNVADATKNNLAKLAAFVSQSISSTSQALGTGGPSQQIAPTI